MPTLSMWVSGGITIHLPIKLKFLVLMYIKYKATSNSFFALLYIIGILILKFCRIKKFSSARLTWLWWELTSLFKRTKCTKLSLFGFIYRSSIRQVFLRCSTVAILNIPPFAENAWVTRPPVNSPYPINVILCILNAKFISFYHVLVLCVLT